MKKVLLSAMILTVLAGSTLAGNPSPTFHGFYAGGGMAYSKGDFKVQGNGFSKATSSSGVGGNGFLGYGTVVYGGCLYLGTELGFGFDGSRFKDRVYPLSDAINDNVRLKSKSSFLYNIAGRIGCVFSNFLLHAKVGFEGRSKLSVFEENGNLFTTVNRNGFLLGLGVDYAVTNNIFLRAEYNYNFGSQKKPLSLQNITIRTPTQMTLVGAGYKF